MREDAQHFDLGSLGKHVEWVMDELNIPPPEPHSGAVWASAINLMYCSILMNSLRSECARMARFLTRLHINSTVSAQNSTGWLLEFLSL